MDKRIFDLRLKYCGMSYEELVHAINERGNVTGTKATLSKSVNCPEYPYQHEIRREADAVTLDWVEARRSQIIKTVKRHMALSGLDTNAEITVPLCIDGEAPVLMVGNLVDNRSKLQVIGYWSDRDGFRAV